MTNRGDDRVVRALLVHSRNDTSAISDLLVEISTQLTFVTEGPFDVALVVVSPAAVVDPEWIKRFETVRHSHIIPVAIGSIKEAPPEVAELNWIIHDPEALERTRDVVVMAAHSDIDRHRITRALEADALLWRISSSPDHGLIRDMGRIRTIERAISSDDPLARPSSEASAFFKSSKRRAQKDRRKRIWGLIWRIFLVSVLVIVSVSFFNFYRTTLSAQKIALGSNDIAANMGAPHILAARSATTLMTLEPNEVPQSFYSLLLTQQLAEEWPLSYLGPAWDSAINDAVLTNTGTIFADGKGTLIWQSAQHEITDRVQVADGPLYAVSATPDGSRVLTSGMTGTVLTEGNGSVLGRWDVAARQKGTAISADGSVIIARDNSGVHLLDSLGASKRIHDPGLTLISGSTTVFGLSFGTDVIELVDLSTGETEHTWSHEWTAVDASLAKMDYNPLSGKGFVAGPGGQLWLLGTDASVSATGIASIRSPLAVTMTPQGWVIVAGDERGAELIIPDLRLNLGRICAAVDAPTRISVNPEGQLMACLDGLRIVHYELGRLGPVHPDARPSMTTAVSRGPLAAPASLIDEIFIEDGTAVLKMDNGENVTFLREATAVARSDDGANALIASGDLVFQVEVAASGPKPIATGSSPDGRRIEKIGWANESTILIQTAGGNVWNMRGCAGCRSSATILEAVAQRMKSICFAEDQTKIFPPDVLVRLNMTVCPAPFNSREP